MSFYIIIRGPAAVGKSCIAKELAKLLKANYFSFDDIMRQKSLDTIEGDGIPEKNFLQANETVIPAAIEILKKGGIVVFDGCFYRKQQVEHLEKNLIFKHYVFSLRASLKECVARNKPRKNPLAQQAVKEVHRLVNKHRIGTEIQTSGKTIKEVIDVIMQKIKHD